MHEFKNIAFKISKGLELQSYVRTGALFFFCAGRLKQWNMVPTAAAITLAAHAIGNAVLLHVIFSPFLEYESIVMVS